MLDRTALRHQLEDLAARREENRRLAQGSTILLPTGTRAIDVIKLTDRLCQTIDEVALLVPHQQQGTALNWAQRDAATLRKLLAPPTGPPEPTRPEQVVSILGIGRTEAAVMIAQSAQRTHEPGEQVPQ